MLRKLEETIGKWASAEKAIPPIPPVQQASKAGVYMVQPQVPSNQGVIQIGHLGLKMDDPDYPAVDLMNYIARRRLVLITHHQGRPHRQRARLFDGLDLLGRTAVPGDLRGVLSDEELPRSSSPRS